jgi:hypothetical protein
VIYLHFFWTEISFIGRTIHNDEIIICISAGASNVPVTHLLGKWLGQKGSTLKYSDSDRTRPETNPKMKIRNKKSGD